MTEPRSPSPIDQVAADHVTALAGLDPVFAIHTGLPGSPGLPDYSPDGWAAREDLRRRTLAALRGLEPTDATDRITLAAIEERFAAESALQTAGEWAAQLNPITSPLTGLRAIFDLVPTATLDDWAAIATRLADLPDALAGYRASLRASADRGLAPARRQVEAALRRAVALADEATSFFVVFAATARPDGTAPPAALAADLERAAEAARRAYADMAAFLADELGPRARSDDAFGRDRYALWLPYFTGLQLDLDETYAWGLEELARTTAEQEAAARAIAGSGASIDDAIAVLDRDPARKLLGLDALRDWVQETADQAIAALDGTHFDIPAPVRRVEARIDPDRSGGVHYSAPSDDFTRPGRVWWSVPPGLTEFNSWREKTTVYHEAVPGHHLQNGLTIHNRAGLNLWRRHAARTSAHGEGWALYAERLMQELGFADDPGDRLGLLDGQRMRAARVVLDIGVHLRLPAPRRWGGGSWDAAKAWDFLRANVRWDEAFLKAELDRYLGWPGQAPSYKIGQRRWTQIRQEARLRAQAQGQDFDLKRFHGEALRLGPLPLSILGSALADAPTT
ncbi:MAG: DUF885 domain-containing protein [Propionibacteriaceae bacterium]|jgi:uncharacterized protein (DUF885 family)|nr:DUF885 domain-containing protein [Propionibacteriaceae bacterium]